MTLYRMSNLLNSVDEVFIMYTTSALEAVEVNPASGIRLKAPTELVVMICGRGVLLGKGRIFLAASSKGKKARKVYHTLVMFTMLASSGSSMGTFQQKSRIAARLAVVPSTSGEGCDREPELPEL